MDNLTHSLFGFSIAEGCLSRFPGASKTFRRTVMLSSVVANNLPDLDFLYAPITEGKLGYLIHHRGHTHTIGVALAISALWLLLDRVIQSYRNRVRPLKEQVCLGFVILVGLLTHIGLDSLNSYGVRPFWPIDNHWHYGDAVFILEPWIWAMLLPELIFSQVPFLFKGLASGALVVALGFCWLAKGVPVSAALVVTLTTAGLGWAIYRRKSQLRFKALVSLGSAAAVILLFVGISNVARSHFYKIHNDEIPQGKLEYVALTPAPANPFCWSLFSLEIEGAGTYVIRRALLAPFPSWISADRCYRRWSNTSLPLSPVPARDSTAVQWLGEWRIPLQRMGWYREHNCEFAAFLKFARFPFLIESADHIFAGDFRYDRETRAGFAEMVIPRVPKQCPQWIPGWVPPTDILWK